MPQIRYYTVTQVREVKVATNDPVQAINLADAMFSGHEVAAEPGRSVVKPVRIHSMAVEEDTLGQ